jgi:succinate dehydrogenase/fumarate reductase flavoprotein subunit
MGGVQADMNMNTEVPGLLVAGEAVGGANGANRLSGNAITEALVFGRQAGRTAAEWVKEVDTLPPGLNAARDTLELLAGNGPEKSPNSAEMLQSLQQTMADNVGPLRSQLSLNRARDRIDGLSSILGERPFGGGMAFDMVRLDWLDLRNMLTVARAVTQAALNRTESRGAHQREDFPGMLPEWNVNQVIRLNGGRLDISQAPVAVMEAAQ